MVRNIILRNMINAVKSICGRLAWWEAELVVRVRKGVKYACLIFKTAAGAVFEATANYNKVGQAFYRSLKIEGIILRFS